MPINILKEPRDDKYQKLIQYAFKTCKTFVFAMQKEILTYYGGPKVLKKLEPYKIDELKAIYYPQIDYYNEDATFYFYECNENTKFIIMEAVNGLYEWRYPDFPEDLTFLDDKGEVWMFSISHEEMAGINEKDNAEVEFVKDIIGLEIYIRERVYTDDEAMEAINHLFYLINYYFSWLSSYEGPKLKSELADSENSPYYEYWNDFFYEYNISEHSLAYEIAYFSYLLKLKAPIYAFDFSNLLNDIDNTSFLVQTLIKNVDNDSQIVHSFLDYFKLQYAKEK